MTQVRIFLLHHQSFFLTSMSSSFVGRSQYFFNKNGSLLKEGRALFETAWSGSVKRSVAATSPRMAVTRGFFSSSTTLKKSSSSLSSALSAKRLNSSLNTSRSFTTSSLLKNQAQKDATIKPSQGISLGEIASTFNQANKTAKGPISGTNKFPGNSSIWVGYWLIGSSSLVFGIVVLGGLTRLTESGLSITEWKPVTGSIPPLNQAEWEAEFEKYKSSPEFKILNSHITMEDFKFIFFMEWIHRLWGRAIGLGVVLPAIYFISKRQVSKRVATRLVGITLLVGLQGAIGWWMVHSGLQHENFQDPGAHPRVSQYRLTTHLGAAFLLYTAMMFTGLEVIREAKWFRNPAAAVTQFHLLESPILKRYKNVTTALLFLIFVTAMSGGMVAGLDAGLIYNQFPYMGEGLVPPTSELMDAHYAKKADNSDLFWRNMLENPTTVQLNHRILATTTFFAVLGHHMYTLRMKPFLPRPAFRAAAAMMGFVGVQVGLGITTLLYLVPVPLASAHQAGSLVLLTSAIVLAARLKNPRMFIRFAVASMREKAKQSAKAAGTKASKIKDVTEKAIKSTNL
ncbi:COX15-CtaA-domain-containing protein [Nadsonia fulvescens var. elongata DSM 6958]|uniref:COX15-CtaA-domain-containing protein n=1 Tax=Nadsonia fulvescens var. elongata DSM 6958 TaxID=857566 RepID=A0A1E3PG88_9ASCO|nr:COX15-CtaA-domain-containing protein [Nadsonia fulvescens var. elongata DSM 6958]